MKQYPVVKVNLPEAVHAKHMVNNWAVGQERTKASLRYQPKYQEVVSTQTKRYAQHLVITAKFGTK